jgi:two-component system, LuxR family, sensor kinase FixL
MNWVIVIWSMVTAVCLTLAVVHGLVWVRQRAAWANLLFALTAVGTAAMAGSELRMLLASTVEDFGTALRWFHLPVWITVLGLLGFVRCYLNTGRSWLAWSAAGLRTASLVLNFALPPNLNYREITDLRHVVFLGTPVSIPVGVPDPRMVVGQLSLLFLLLFVVDATAAAWRLGNRRRAVMVGGGVTFFVAAGMGQAILVFWGWVEWPITASLFFSGIVAAMGYELSSDLLRAAQLADSLREREGELRRERALTDAVFNSVPGLLYLYAADGRFVRWNRQYEIRTGYTSAELAWMNVTDWFRPEDLEVMRLAWNKVFAGGNVDTELPVRMKDGTCVPYLLTGVRVLIDEQPHLVGIGIDIAERKAMEKQAAQQRAELAHLSRVASLGELSGSLAHELNQPLAIILTNAQAAQRLLASQSPDLDEVRQILADIVAEDRRAGEVIRRLHALIKRGESERRPLAVNELVLEVVSLMRSELLGRGITLQMQLADSLPPIAGERIPLVQVLINLVANACDAMAERPAAERQLTLSTHVEVDLVQISVRDSGCGLPGAGARIFESFFTTKAHGLGMGLPICRTIVTAHAGKIWAEDNADQGATFHVSLPRAEATA